MVKLEKDKSYFVVTVDIPYSEMNFILKRNFKSYKKLDITGDEYDYDVGIDNPETYISFSKMKEAKNSKKNKRLKKAIENALNGFYKKVEKINEIDQATLKELYGNIV